MVMHPMGNVPEWALPRTHLLTALLAPDKASSVAHSNNQQHHFNSTNINT